MFYYNNNYEQNESEQTYLNPDMVNQISLCHNTPFFHGLLSLSQEVATRVAEEAWLYYENAFNICFNYIHNFYLLINFVANLKNSATSSSYSFQLRLKIVWNLERSCSWCYITILVPFCVYFTICTWCKWNLIHIVS